MDIYRDLDSAPLTDDYLLSEDIWKQFQIEEMQLQALPILDITSMLCPKNCKVEHDCMWNGHCRGGRHGGAACEGPKPQQSVLKPALRVAVDPNTVVPMTTPQLSIQTPPISDDEDAKPTQTLRHLETAIFENIHMLEADDDELSDYFRGDDDDFGFFDEEIEEEEEEEEEERQEVRLRADQMRAFYAAESDHSYHKGNHAGMHSSLGIDTPSDSEEEIDVVSLAEKAKPAGAALPTNPSTKDRRQLQRTMQSRFPRARRGAPKRGRQHKRPYKRRAAYSSDSEQEPSEKRSLHNNMERQRRIDLRNLFNDLKKLVPEVNKKQRAAKVLILRGAAQYCRDLAGTGDVLARRAEALRRQQQRYRARLAALRRDLAMKR